MFLYAGNVVVKVVRYVNAAQNLYAVFHTISVTPLLVTPIDHIKHSQVCH